MGRREYFGVFIRNVQFNLNRVVNNKLLTNTIISLSTKLRVLKLNGNKLHFLYSMRGLNAINHVTYCVTYWVTYWGHKYSKINQYTNIIRSYIGRHEFIIPSWECHNTLNIQYLFRFLVPCSKESKLWNMTATYVLAYWICVHERCLYIVNC